MNQVKKSPSYPLFGSSRNALPQLTAAHSSSAFLSLCHWEPTTCIYLLAAAPIIFLRQRPRFPRNGSLLLIGQFKERNAELEWAAVSWRGALRDDPNNSCEGRVSRKLRPRKLRPRTLKTQTLWVSPKLRPERLWPSGRLENSDPKDKTNLDSECQRVLQAVFFTVRRYLNMQRKYHKKKRTKTRN